MYHQRQFSMIAQKPRAKTHKKKFTAEDDDKLRRLIKQYGFQWTKISKEFQSRNARQCRDRWNHYLSPNVDNSGWTQEEDDFLLSCFRQYGNKWSGIAQYFDKRTSVNIRNRCCKILKKNNINMRLRAGPTFLNDLNRRCNTGSKKGPQQNQGVPQCNQFFPMQYPYQYFNYNLPLNPSNSQQMMPMPYQQYPMMPNPSLPFVPFIPHQPMMQQSAIPQSATMNEAVQQFIADYPLDPQLENLSKNDEQQKVVLPPISDLPCTLQVGNFPYDFAK